MYKTFSFRISILFIFIFLLSGSLVSRADATNDSTYLIKEMEKRLWPTYDFVIPLKYLNESTNHYYKEQYLQEIIDKLPVDTLKARQEIPTITKLPLVYTNYELFDSVPLFKEEFSGNKNLYWLENGMILSKNARKFIQDFMIKHPELVKYNISTMETPPRKFYATVNPSDHSIEIKEVEINAAEKIPVEIEKKHWIKNFVASLQFSQAYISPNWYQGGNNNLNMLANIYYNVKLNPVFHPNLLFESTMQYKLGIYSAPDDSLRNYSVSEDLLQLNLTFGVKAFKRWYYSFTAQFKTQLLNSYESNTYNMKAAFLSPADLTLGIGMTYNLVSKNKKITFDASIAPLSFNMRTCLKPNNILNHDAYGIDPDKKYVIEIGSSAEAKMSWKLARNITWNSRLFFFTDYNYAYADWENTFMMQINNYLTTQIYVHARYDTSTPTPANPHWHNLQLKEILSFGVAYKFSTL